MLSNNRDKFHKVSAVNWGFNKTMDAKPKVELFDLPKEL